jgi:hypothetical protein
MGKLLIRKWGSFFLVLMLAVSVSMLTGCEGDTGPQGPAGMDGADGAPGADAPGAHAGESCNVCHGTGADWDIGVAHPAALEKPVVGDIVVARSAGDVLTVTFSVTDAAGDPVVGIMDAPGDAGNIRVYMADLVPAGTPTANLPQATWGDAVAWPTGFLEMWAEEHGDDVGVVATDNLDGTYSFQMAATPPFVGVGTDAPEGDLAHTQRVYVRADARDIPGLNRSIGVADFTMPAAGAATAALADGDTVRTIVDPSACIACHSDPLEHAGHGSSGSGYQSPQVCNMCHSPIGVDGDAMQADGAWLASLIHGIHSASNWYDAATDTGFDFSEVTFPKQVKDCTICHFDAGQDLANAWAENPTQEVCTTCHDVTFSGADPTHSGGAMADNSGCRLCHPATGVGVGQSVTTAHTLTTIKENPAHDGSAPPSITPNYTSTITLSDDANADGVYEAGEEILVTVTVSNMAAGDYNVEGAARSANLYVYGPRSKSVPVLTPGSTTDPAFDPATMLADQGRTMLAWLEDEDDAGNTIYVPNTDAQVATDADGFKYQLFAIPADLADGTYMAMAYVTTDLADCPGAIYRNSVCIDGWTLTTFQVGTATEELRVAGDCTQNCHVDNDWGSMYHRSYFGTDGCIACHDQSGNHADPIANRVHAVHAACPECDLLNDPTDPVPWDEVTFPQVIGSCDACHTSGDDSYVTLPAAWGAACIGCHGSTPGAYDHMLQNGAPFGAH